MLVFTHQNFTITVEPNPDDYRGGFTWSIAEPADSVSDADIILAEGLEPTQGLAVTEALKFTQGLL